MGYVAKKSHVTKSGAKKDYWRARFTDPDGILRSKNFDRKIDAQRYVTLMESAQLRGEWVDPRHARTSFGDVARTWQAAQIHRAGTASAVECDLRLHILPVFEARPIGSIRTGDVQRFIKILVEKGLAPASVIRPYRWVASIFKAAVADGLIARSPCVDVKLPAKTEVEVVPMRSDEVAALVNLVPDRYRAFVLVGAGAGLRIGEACGLTLPNVDFLRRTIRVTQQLAVFPRQAPHQADVKAKASRRTIPVGDVVINALAEHLRQFPAEVQMAAFPSGTPEPLIFTNKRDLPVRRDTVGDSLRPYFRAAGLADTASYHDLRHFYASLLIAKGGSVKVVQARLGHASAVETLNTYSHLWPDDDALSRTAVDAALGGAPHTRPMAVEG